ncbi:MAG: hypothetical protein IPM29_10050 [Planctomycetes bacterium]|nr:hypothetical protein [Planctomycetota bacterium]
MSTVSIAVRTLDVPPAPAADETPPTAAERERATELLLAVLARHAPAGQPVQECLPVVGQAPDEAGHTLFVLPFDQRAVSGALLSDLAALAAETGGFATLLQVGEGLVVVRADGIDVHGPGLAGATGLSDLAARIARETAVDRWIEACDDEVLERIARDAPHRRALDLSRSQVTDAGLASLEQFDELWSVDLSGTRIGDAGAAAIGTLGALRELVLDGTAITDAGLAKLRGLHELETLSLADTAVGDAGVAAIAHLLGLRAVQLAGTGITDAALTALAELPDLEELGLAGTAVTPAAVDELLARFPELVIER